MVNFLKKVFSFIARYFFSGTLFIIPLVATGYFIFISLYWLDNLILLPYPGLSLLIILSLITLIGYFSSHFASKSLSEWLTLQLRRVPLIRLIYSPLRDLMEAFVGKNRKFEKPILVLIDKENQRYRIGFITQDDLATLDMPHMAAVYFPQSYTTAGDLFIVPTSHIKPLKISGTIAMKFILSGGISNLTESDNVTEK